MKRFFFSAVCTATLLVACTDDASSVTEASLMNSSESADTSSSAGVDENGTESSSSGAANIHYEVNPLGDSASDGSAQSNDDNQITTSSSKTAYKFETEKTLLYDLNPSASGYVTAYYEENGIQYLGGDINGSYLVTYRILEDESHNKFLAWLWHVAYLHNGFCEEDKTYFEGVCHRQNGELVNYRELDACQVRNLQLSCVAPLNTDLDDKAVLDSLASNLKDFVDENWSKQEEPQEPSTATSASSSS